MILYYAIGGGLGHLTRARAVVHTLGLGAGERVALLTASPYARDPRIVGDFRVLQAPLELAGERGEFRWWLQTLLDHLRPSAIYLDTFPAGIIGELAGVRLGDAVAVYHLARLLRWPEYEQQLAGLTGALPTFATTYLLEPLAEAHEAFLRAHSGDLRPLALRDPPPPAGEPPAELRDLRRDGRPIWLIVHAGPGQEIVELAAYAGELRAAEGVDPHLVLIAPQRPPGLPAEVLHLDLYPATPLFPLADRIITACGFNAMRETEPYRDRHRFLPFERRFDDQYQRAARRRAEHETGRTGEAPCM